ncbi:MAG: hypothetical protein R3E32_05580 [Chitinophagales bacterium]
MCFGENTGEITSSSTGGVGGNEYLWSNGATTASINTLTAGTGNGNRRQRRNRHG